MSLIDSFVQLERRIKVILREVDREQLTRFDRTSFDKIKLALTQLKLDIRDYEYAETRAEQQKWAKISHNNLRALQHYILQLSDVFGPVDVAELSAGIDLLQSNIE